MKTKGSSWIAAKGSKLPGGTKGVRVLGISIHIPLGKLLKLFKR